MDDHEGGCLCGAVRYATRGAPLTVTICHCRFCQRATGSAFLVEPIFRRAAFEITAGTPARYELRSEGSGKTVTVHFCAVCGTKTHLAFERFADVIGVYGGTFDDPNWFERKPGGVKHIFLDVAQRGAVIPPGIPTYRQHALSADGAANEPIVFEHFHLVGGDAPT